MAKLNEILVLEMRSKYASGKYTIEQLAREYGVSWNAARSAIKGTSYQNVDMITGDVEDEAQASEARLMALIGSNPVMPAAEPEEDPLEAILRRRAGAASADALRARETHIVEQSSEEKVDE